MVESVGGADHSSLCRHTALHRVQPTRNVNKFNNVMDIKNEEEMANGEHSLRDAPTSQIITIFTYSYLSYMTRAAIRTRRSSSTRNTYKTDSQPTQHKINSNGDDMCVAEWFRDGF